MGRDNNKESYHTHAAIYIFFVKRLFYRTCACENVRKREFSAGSKHGRQYIERSKVDTEEMKEDDDCVLVLSFSVYTNTMIARFSPSC